MNRGRDEEERKGRERGRRERDVPAVATAISQQSKHVKRPGQANEHVQMHADAHKAL